MSNAVILKTSAWSRFHPLRSRAEPLQVTYEPDENKPPWSQLNKTALVHFQTSCPTSPFQTSFSSPLPSEVPRSWPLQNTPIANILPFANLRACASPRSTSTETCLDCILAKRTARTLATDYSPSENDDKTDYVSVDHYKCGMKSAKENKAFANAVPLADLPPVSQNAEVTCRVFVAIPKTLQPLKVCEERLNGITVAQPSKYAALMSNC
ncbi:hypothetical protein MRX96_022387 [Rhipicephalus microplus]